MPYSTPRIPQPRDAGFGYTIGDSTTSGPAGKGALGANTHVLISKTGLTKQNVPPRRTCHPRLDSPHTRRGRRSETGPVP